MSRTLIVSQDNTGEYSTVREAYDSIKYGEEATIFVKKGAYFEKLIFEKPNITLKGEGRDNTVIRYNDCAKRKGSDPAIESTFSTATLHITPEGENFRMEDICIENCAGYGKIVGQAVALYLDADKSIVKNCSLKGFQDTLFNGPCPFDDGEVHNIVRRQYFKDCYIEGDVDFIFGGGVVVFSNCEIFSKQRPDGYNGYVTAACTEECLEFGYVFIDCKITGNAKEGMVYLGRPWREFAKTVFINCPMGELISKELYSPWHKGDPDGRTKTCFYGVYDKNGIDCTADWVHILSEEEAKKYTLHNIFGEWGDSLG